jgi:hypothetical protein
MDDGTPFRTVEFSGKIRTGTGHGSTVVALVMDEISGKQKFFLDLYDPHMTHMQQRMDISHADGDEARSVDISLDAGRLAVLTQRGKFDCLIRRCVTRRRASLLVHIRPKYKAV